MFHDEPHYYPAERRVRFSLTVSVPVEQVDAFAACMCGDDDDIILAAEKAMRLKLREDWPDEAEGLEQIELETERGTTVKLREFAGDGLEAGA